MSARPRERPTELIGAFESTYQPAHDTDVAERTQHVQRRDADLQLLRGCGVRRVRYPIRWHRVEREPRRFDWAETDAVFETIAESGLRPIVDLVHHTSYPQWLCDGFADRRFPYAYLRYVEAVFDRYPAITEYTLFNEPFATLLLCGHEAIWPPYGSGSSDFVTLMTNVVPALAEASRRCKVDRPDAIHMWCDSAEHHSGDSPSGRRYAAYANDRRFFVLDSMLGRWFDEPDARHFVGDVLANGGRALLDLEPGHVDQVGLDYYAHSQWHFTDAGGSSPAPNPVPLADLIAEYANRYARPVWIGETNMRGYPSDRANWLKYVLEQSELAVARGIDLRGVCWFPFVDSCDWDSLLARSDGHVDPVGVFWLDDRLDRRPSSMSRSFELAANGAPAGDLPAYAWRQPVAAWLRGYAAQIAHWQLEPVPDEPWRGGLPGDEVFAALTVRQAS